MRDTKSNFSKHDTILWSLLLALFVVSCSRVPSDTATPISAVRPRPSATATAALTLPPPTDTVTPQPAATATDSPTATPSSTPTATATPTRTPSPTITPTPRHPLSIEAMRQDSYPAAELTLEATLEWGPGYERFIVSYLSEGNKIYALLTIPRGERPATGWPVILFNHGYIPPDQYRTTERYEAYVDGFARHDYMVLRSDYRGHGRSEGVASGGYGSPAYTVDVLNALAAIKTHPDADPERIGMWGHSMGGQVTLRAMVVSDEIRAGVIWAGVIGSYPDLLERWRRRSGPTPTPDPENPRRGWRSSLVEQYGSPQENPAFWAEISPNSYLAEISGPLQLHHGTADQSVPYELSELVQAEMEEAGRLSQLWLYEGDDHNLSINFSLAMERSILFFDRWVKGLGLP